MKRWNINPKKRKFSWGDMDVITLGEEGRGRKLTLIPYHAKDDAEYLDIGKTRSGKIKIVEGDWHDECWVAVLRMGKYKCLQRDTVLGVQPEG